MIVHCICGKECKDIRGLNRHKTYCIQVGGKPYHEVLSLEAKERWNKGREKAVQVNKENALLRTKNKQRVKCQRAECFNFVGPNGLLYCSKTCAGIVNNIGRIKIPRRLCTFCGKTGLNEYCSGKCRIAHKWQLDKERWFAGENNLTEYFAQRALIELRGNSCEECGWMRIHPTTGNIPTEFHHVDGDRTNNRRSNVKILCPSCHSLTPNFGSLNGLLERREIKLRRQKPNDAADACGASFSGSDSHLPPHKIN